VADQSSSEGLSAHQHHLEAEHDELQGWAVAFRVDYPLVGLFVDSDAGYDVVAGVVAFVGAWVDFSR